MKHVRSVLPLLALALSSIASAQTSEYYSFDGVGFPTCYNVTVVHNATSVDDSKSSPGQSPALQHQTPDVARLLTPSPL